MRPSSPTTGAPLMRCSDSISAASCTDVSGRSVSGSGVMMSARRHRQRALVELLDALEQLDQLVVVQHHAERRQRAGRRGQHPGPQRGLAAQPFEQSRNVLAGQEAFVWLRTRTPLSSCPLQRQLSYIALNSTSLPVD